jgi:hypothetical protein
MTTLALIFLWANRGNAPLWIQTDPLPTIPARIKKNFKLTHYPCSGELHSCEWIAAAQGTRGRSMVGFLVRN